MDPSDGSLKELFQRAKSQEDELDQLEPQTEVFKAHLQTLIDSFEQCRQLIQKLSLFSTNEELEDISTNDIQYLTVDYTLAELKNRSYDDDRIAALKQSSELLESFLTNVDHYGLLTSADRKLYECFLESRTSFRIISSTNPEEKRKIKIGRFQEEKALKQKLEYLRNESRKSNIDDETIRDLYLAEVSLAVNRTFSSLDSTTQELEILSQMRQAAPVNPGPTLDSREATRSTEYSDRLDGPTTLAGLGRRGGPLLSPSGKPLQPFTIVGKRTQLQEGVFRPGHNLPTMSIDEYLEEERRRGGIIEGTGDEPKPAPDEDDMAEVDAATKKAREWDEFVEANPKGAGNSMNRG